VPDLHLDTTAPLAPTVSGTALVVDTTPTWTWVAGGGGNGTFRYQLDSEAGTWVAIAGTTYTATTALADGSHTLYVQESDHGSNWSTSGSFATTIDATAPTAPVVDGVAGSQDLSPTWTWTAGGGGNGTFRYQLDSEAGTWIETTETSFTPVTDFGNGESHILYVQERDPIGNWSLSGSFTTALVVEGALTITSSSITSATEGMSYTYQVTASVEGTTFQLDAASNHPTGLSIDATAGLVTYDPQTDDEAGTYTIVVLATDPFGRSATQTYTLTVAAVDDMPEFVTAIPAADSPEAHALAGHTYELVIEGSDEETPGSDLVYTLGGTPPGNMTITTFVDSADSLTKARITWDALDTDINTSIAVEVIVTAGDDTITLSFNIQVLPPLVVDPDGMVVVRKNAVDVNESFAISGGDPQSGTPSYYAFELRNEANAVVDSGQISDDGAGNYVYVFSTAGLTEGIYTLVVTDGMGFSIHGAIEVNDVAVESVPLDDTIDDPTVETTLTISQGDLAGTEITIPADPDRGDFEFEIGTVAEPPEMPAPETGIFLAITARTPEGEDIIFNEPVEITIPYGSNASFSRPEDIRIYTFSAELGRWVPVTDYTVDTVSGTITFRVNHFSLFAVAQPEIFSGPAIAGGIDAEDFRMISFPGFPDEPDLVKNLESILGTYDNVEWRSAAYNPDPVDVDDLYDEADEPGFAGKHPLRPGKAYWLISRDTVNLEVKGLSLDTSRPFDLILKPGWNMVANPFKGSASIRVSRHGITFVSASGAETLIGSQFYKFDPSTDSATGDTVWYTPVAFSSGSMATYEGYWVENLHSADITLRFSLSSLSADLRGNSVPFYEKLVRYARGSLHKMMDAISTVSYADKPSNSPPPPPSMASNGNSSAIGIVDPDGGGGGCFVETVTGTAKSKRNVGALLLIAALLFGSAVACRVVADI
ncbi:MAG: Ig domain-containing protein, partial [Desulfobacterales bacterium]